ncbi:MAG TPA: CDP-alcohol phosphatidyltransferase family protein [Pseudolabrys sp.]|nr:CDP-alcohol phosphatidyltransferase family protein [Pseudolabrys sp.]
MALLALILATGGHWSAMFLCLGAALIIDGVDGSLAREFAVGDVLPRWSGETLDYVVDFTTYVFVPAYAIAASGLLPQELAVASGVLIAIVGALYFADRDMKSEDHYFRGFPALWNIAAFYLYVMEPPGWLSAAGIVMLAILTFVPIRFVHPLRVARLRALNVALLILWGVLALIAVIANLEPAFWVKVALGALAVYFCGFGLLPVREK